MWTQHFSWKMKLWIVNPGLINSYNTFMYTADDRHCKMGARGLSPSLCRIILPLPFEENKNKTPPPKQPCACIFVCVCVCLHHTLLHFPSLCHTAGVLWLSDATNDVPFYWPVRILRGGLHQARGQCQVRAKTGIFLSPFYNSHSFFSLYSILSSFHVYVVYAS